MLVLRAPAIATPALSWLLNDGIASYILVIKTVYALPLNRIQADRGAGRGEGFNINIPMPPGTGVGGYEALFDRAVIPALRAFKPELILVCWVPCRAEGGGEGWGEGVARSIVHVVQALR